jgi:type IV pilus assembly protein PilM
VSAAPIPLPLPPEEHGGGFSAFLQRGGAWLRKRFIDPERPLAAIEVRRRAVGLVRLVREGRKLVLGAAASLELPEGTVELSMAQPNVLDPIRFRQVLHGVLERAGVPAGSQVTLVLPDPVARVALLPAAEVKGKRRSDTEELIRFRLRKAVPFDVRDAQVDHVRLGARAEDPVLVAAIARPVLRGYEEICESVGLHAGIVELSGLSLLAGTGAKLGSADRLLVNWDDGYVSFLLVRSERLVLVRTLTGDTAASMDQVAREVTNTSLYYRERLGGLGLKEVLVRSAVVPPAEAAALVGQALETEAKPLDAWTGLTGDYRPVAHALAGAAASVVRKAA